MAAYLEPIQRSSTGLVRRRISLEHLDHQTLTPFLHTLIQETLDLIHSISVPTPGKIELALDGFKVCVEQPTAFGERRVQQCRTVQVEEIKGEEVYFDFNVLGFYVLAFPF
jgi:hypothetical protein